LKIAGIVLAGGLSSRMGQDKAQLLLDQVTLLSRSVTLLSSLNLTQVFVSGNYQGFDCITDVEASLGPVGGIHACVESLFLEYDALFILPVDMPLIREDECFELLHLFEQYPQGVFYEEATFPLILPLTKQLKNYLAEVLTYPEKKQRSLYRLIKTVKLQPVKYPASNKIRFQNSNTLEQWETCIKSYHAQNETEE